VRGGLVDMKNRVAMFFGAGASKAFGAPLTADILPLLFKKIADEDLFDKIVKEWRQDECLKAYDPLNDAEVPSELKKLGRWIYEVGKASYCSIVSTNYDEIIEAEVYKRFLSGAPEPRPFDRVNQAVNFGIVGVIAQRGGSSIHRPPAARRF
jgi:hypothetical protein